MTTTYHIHPAIGIARLGNSPTEFCIGPETPGGLPIACDAEGNPILDDGREVPIKKFKDGEGRIKRQAARFHVCVHDDDHLEGKPIAIGDPVEGGGFNGFLVNIQWRVYLANKKAVWYEFDQLEGEHGYASRHPRRNADVTDSTDRQRLIVDPGPQSVEGPEVDQDGEPVDTRRRASFARGANPYYAQSFPPPLQPHPVDTLGEIMTDEAGHLLVLGGFGNSGSAKTGPDDPIIRDYANNDGWFDDTSDGPVMARLKFFVPDIQRYRFVDVAAPSWVIAGYPAYVPEIFDMVTADDVLFDLGVRELATRTDLYGAPPFDRPQRIDSSDPEAIAWWQTQELRYNPDYHPWFFRDVWPILSRPYGFTWLTRVLYGSNFPHDISERGTFYEPRLSQAPEEDGREKLLAALEEKLCPHQNRQRASGATSVDAEQTIEFIRKHLCHPPGDGPDPFRDQRMFLFSVLRLPGEENEFKDLRRPDSRTHNVPLMPLLAGDNPISNTLPSKFLRLTDTQLFVLKQWAAGKFINEREEWPDGSPLAPLRGNPPVGNEPGGAERTGHALDRGVMANVLGGAFCPGGEIGWSLRNPSNYAAPYRIKADPEYYNFGQTPANAYYKPELDYAYYTDTELSQDEDLAIGLQPGDLTKRMALPWQADFNECSFQTIDITYDEWNDIYPDDPTDPRLKRAQTTWQTLWWPAHRPHQVFVVTGVTGGEASYEPVDWAKGIPQTDAGDLKMVTSWSELGFVVKNPFYQGDPAVPPKPWEDPGSNPLYIAVEINEPSENGSDQDAAPLKAPKETERKGRRRERNVYKSGMS